MAISAKLLGEDEYVVVSTRTHWKALIFPVFLLLVVAGGGGFLAAVVPSGGLQTPARIAIGVVGLLVLVVFGAKPFLNWFFSTYTLTNRRLITRHGILTRTGRDIPLMRINDVSYEHGLIDRMLGCGTLAIESAGERGQVILPDVPHVEHMHLQMSDLLFGGPEGKPGDGILDDEAPPEQLRRRPSEAAPQPPREDPDAETLFSSEDNDRR
ncbi:PH domain-containing protein [Kribbella endophytica]